MSPRRALSRSIGAALATVLAAANALLPASSAVAAPAYTTEERAKAIAQPAAIFVEMLAVGVVRDKRTLQPVYPDPVTVSVRCSGFVVNPNGTAITLPSCVAPDDKTLANWSFEAVAFAKKVDEGQRPQFLANLRNTAVFTGDSQTERPAVHIYAQMNTATFGLTDSTAWPAEVVPPADSNTGLAVIKIAKENLPSVEVNTSADLSTVSAPIEIAYAPSSGKTLTIRSRTVSIAGAQPGGGDWAYRLDQELPWESRGGLVTDADGKAIGVAVPNPQGQIKTVHSTEAIKLLLDAARVKSELGPTDLLYRQALDDYFGGRYAEAIKKFDQVLAASPMNETAAALRKAASDRKAIEGGGESESSSPVLLIVVISVIGVALVGSLVFVGVAMMRRNNRRGGEDDLLPVSVNPFITSGAGAYTGNYSVSTPPAPAGYSPVPPIPGPPQPIPHPPIQHPPVQQMPMHQPVAPQPMPQPVPPTTQPVAPQSAPPVHQQPPVGDPVFHQQPVVPQPSPADTPTQIITAEALRQGAPADPPQPAPQQPAQQPPAQQPPAPQQPPVQAQPPAPQAPPPTQPGPAPLQWPAFDWPEDSSHNPSPNEGGRNAQDR